MADNIEWIVIEKFGKEIGAIGFIGDNAVTVVAFYDDFDANKDGKVGFGEWAIGKISPINIKGNAIVEVAMQARVEMDIILRDSSFQTMAANLFINFAKGLIADGIYAAYFSRGVSSIAKPIAGRMTENIVKQFVIRKGMEKAVKSAYDATVR